jgi:hypothetical protein
MTDLYLIGMAYLNTFLVIKTFYYEILYKIIILGSGSVM